MNLEKEQDQDLDQLHHTISNVGKIAVDIQDELKNQDDALTELGKDTDSAAGRLKNAMTRINKVLDDTADKRPWIAVGVLMLILLIVIVIIVLVLVFTLKK